MIYVTGDTHGKQEVWMEQIHPALTAGDILIVAGDFGVGFWGNTEQQFYDFLGQQDYTVLFVDGNHENFDELDTYPTEEWNGGRVHRLRPNVLHLLRGEVFCIEGIKIFAFGGGFSADKARRREHLSWWPQEMPSEEDYENARVHLQENDYAVDVILTHAPPIDSMDYFARFPQYGGKGVLAEEWPLNAFLEFEVRQKVSYRKWYFGHLHIDAEIFRDQTAVMNSIRELESGAIVRQWGI